MTGLVTVLTVCAAEFTLLTVFTLYVIVSVVLPGATPNLSVSNNLDGSKDLSSTKSLPVMLNTRFVGSATESDVISESEPNPNCK